MQLAMNIPQTVDFYGYRLHFDGRAVRYVDGYGCWHVVAASLHVLYRCDPTEILNRISCFCD